MTRRTRIVIGAAVIAVAAVVAAVTLGDGEPEPERSADGPLVAESAAADSTLRLFAERAATFAGVEVWNEGSEPVVLEEIVPVDPESGAEVVGALAAPSPETGLVVGYAAFPPVMTAAMRGIELPDFLPLKGYEVPPGDARTQLFVGVQSTEEEGLVRILSFELEYRVGDELYRLAIPAAVALCTPRTAWDGLRCTSSAP